MMFNQKSPGEQFSNCVLSFSVSSGLFPKAVLPRIPIGEDAKSRAPGIRQERHPEACPLPCPHTLEAVEHGLQMMPRRLDGRAISLQILSSPPTNSCQDLEGSCFSFRPPREEDGKSNERGWEQAWPQHTLGDASHLVKARGPRAHGRPVTARGALRVKELPIKCSPALRLPQFSRHPMVPHRESRLGGSALGNSCSRLLLLRGISHVATRTLELSVLFGRRSRETLTGPLSNDCNAYRTSESPRERGWVLGGKDP